MSLKIALVDCCFFIDFDNTITVSDVLKDIIRQFSINNDWVLLEKAWVEGQIGAKECLEGQLKNIRLSKKDLCCFLKDVHIDPYFVPLLSFLIKEGNQPVILSDNFSLIIECILKNHGIQGLVVYANGLDFYRGRLIPSFPYSNPSCPTCAHCKRIHLTSDMVENKKIIYIGDGRSDLCAARVSDLVFAKDALLQQLTKEGKWCVEFKNFKDINQYLVPKNLFVPSQAFDCQSKSV